MFRPTIYFYVVFILLSSFTAFSSESFTKDGLRYFKGSCKAKDILFFLKKNRTKYILGKKTSIPKVHMLTDYFRNSIGELDGKLLIAVPKILHIKNHVRLSFYTNGPLMIHTKRYKIKRKFYKKLPNLSLKGMDKKAVRKFFRDMESVETDYFKFYEMDGPSLFKYLRSFSAIYPGSLKAVIEGSGRWICEKELILTGM